jgi:hypothetical protein
MNPTLPQLARIRAERIERYERAADRAAKLAPGDYYASNNDVVERTAGVVLTCETHWDACLVMLAAPGL